MASSGTYYVTVTNAGGCSNASDSIEVIASSPLPIQLIDFYARENKEGILVGWTTVSEINNDYFTVERSKDGKNWDGINRIKGAGNSDAQKNYAIIDGNPLSGLNYYRLKQTDYDGTSTYSQTEAQFFSNQKRQYSRLTVYPNPIPG